MRILKHDRLARLGAPSVIAWIIAVSVLALPRPCHAASNGKRPNIIFVLADDLGWSELGCYGNTFNETPQLDALAQNGLRFTRAYAAAPVCSPYRASLLTGQYPARHGILDYLRPQGGALSEELPTFPKRLKVRGYATGYIGKWHLTGYRYHGAKNEVRPTNYGFDEEHLSEIKGVGNGANFYPYIFRSQPIPWLSAGEKALDGNEYLTDRIYHEAVRFIERNHDRPFYLQISHYAPHSILNGKPELVRKYIAKHPPAPSNRKRCYLCQDVGAAGDPGHHWSPDFNPHLAAMLESIDTGMGAILKSLKTLGIDENTLIVFTSDNGGESNVTRNGPLRGGKSQLFEGGIRVPLIVHWPNVVEKNQICETPTSNVDFYPTFLNMTGAPKPSDYTLDGQSILPLFQNPRHALNPRPLFWYYPLEKPHFLGGVAASAMIEGPHKLIRFHNNNQAFLFNLDEDPGETKNLATVQPKTLRKLQTQLSQWEDQFPSQYP